MAAAARAHSAALPDLCGDEEEGEDVDDGDAARPPHHASIASAGTLDFVFDDADGGGTLVRVVLPLADPG